MLPLALIVIGLTGMYVFKKRPYEPMPMRTIEIEIIHRRRGDGDEIHKRKMTQPANVSVQKINEELDALDAAIANEAHPRVKEYLCAAYQALCWARNPNGYAAPSDMRTSLGIKPERVK